MLRSTRPLSNGPRVAAAVFNDLPTGSRSIAGLRLDGLTGVLEYLNGTPSRVLLVRGTGISDGNRLIASQAAPTEILEADGLEGDTVSISGDLSQESRIYAPAALRLLSGLQAAGAGCSAGSASDRSAAWMVVAIIAAVAARLTRRWQRQLQRTSDYRNREGSLGTSSTGMRETRRQKG